MTKTGYFFVFFTILILAIGSYWVYEPRVMPSYQQFLAEDAKARSKLGELNAMVYAELPPPPPGAVQTHFIKNGALGDTTYRGNYLLAGYKLETNPDVIFEYYQSYFDENGWMSRGKITQGSTVSKLYYRGTSCVSIYMPGRNDSDEFSIQVWHDYKQQPFRPVPIMHVLGEKFDKCPP